MPKKLVTSPLCPSEKVTEEQLATDLTVMEMDKTVQRLDRRSFFSNLGVLAAATAGVGLLASSTPKAQAQNSAPPNSTILEVLNFALNFEYLEANLYLAASGQPALTAYLGGGAQVIGLPPSPLSFDAITGATVANLAMDEMHHIELLRVAIFQLGGTPINQPVIDYTLGGKMSITTQAQFLAVARQFTAVGNSAYAGGAALLIANPLVLTTAAQILGTESQHLGGVNALCNFQGVVSPAVDSLDYPPSSPSRFFTLNPTTNPISSNYVTDPAFGPIRTPQQVLGVVYGVTTPSTSPTPAAGTTHGGFFPQGVNGSITST